MTADQASEPRSPDNGDVLEISIKCSRTADELLAELKRLQPDSRGSLRQAIRKGFRAIQKKDFVEGIQKKLNGYQQVLDTRILARLDIHSVQQTKDFQRLDQSVRDLVTALSQGENTVAQLLARQSQALHDHIDQRFDKQARANFKLKAQEHFKQSLFFPDIHARQEQIHEAHHGTCRWIFHPSQHKSSTTGDSIRFGSSTDEVPRQELYENDGEARSGNGDNEHAAADGHSELGSEGNQPSPRQGSGSGNDYGEEQPWSNFVDWLERGKEVYWIFGKAGSGKTTLMNYIDSSYRTKGRLKTWAKGSELVMTSCFFWNPGTALQKSSQGLLRSLLYGMADQQEELISIMMDGQASSTEEYLTSFQVPTWTNQRLISVLRRVLVQKPSSISIFVLIDGLDEFVEDEDILIDIVRLLANTPHVKVCVSSRPEQIFREEFRHSPQLRLQDFNRKDIEKTANDRLRPPLQRYAPSYKGEIEYFIRDVSKRAQGVFLWLDLVIKDIIRGVRHKDTLQELNARLEATPDTIDGIYAYMLSRLNKLYLPESIKYFRYLVANQFPMGRGHLTLLELAFAENFPREELLRNDLTYFETSEFDDVCQNLEIRILTRCAGLVEIEDQRETHPGGWLSTNYRGDVPRSHRIQPVATNSEEQNISRHLRKVDFIHRTAMDFLESHFQTFQESTWQVTTNLALARGQLGLMAIFPIITRKRDSDETFSIAEHIVSLMNFLSHVGAFRTGGSVNGTLIEMVDDTYRLINNVDLRLNGPDFPWRWRASWLQVVNSWIHEKSPFNECPSFAAFFGCCGYISNYISSRRCSGEELNQLLISATFGLAHHSSAFADVDFVSYFNLIEILLLQEAEPNLALLYQDRFDRTQEMTPWGLFVENAVPLIDQDRHQLDGSSNQTVPSYPAYKKLLVAFFLRGADVNTSIYSKKYEYFEGSRFHPFFTLEESALSYVNRICHYAPLGSQELAHLLISRGAVEHRRFRTIGLTNLVERLGGGNEARESVRPRHFQPSQNQSDRLCKVWPWSSGIGIDEEYLRRKKDSYSVLAEIGAELTEADEIDTSKFIFRSSFKSENERDGEGEKCLVEELS